MTPPFHSDLAFAREMDAADPLASYRARFLFPKKQNGHDCLYFCGNSLGLQPATAQAYVEQELRDWAELGVEGHFHARHPWLPYHEFLAEQTARLVGALPHEVVVMNSLTVNLHLLLLSFYRPTRARHKILIEANAFPSDQYAAQSQIKLHGFDAQTSLLELKPREDEATLRMEDVEEFIAREGESIAVILLGGVNYASGQAFDMRRVVAAGHAQGCVVGFDLAHAAGNLVLALHEWDADFAVWCSYKYLNAGPGAIAGCFVHERHGRNADLPRLAGWWGNNKEKRFLMQPEFEALPGAEGWQLSNPPILQLAALRAAMEIFDEAGMDKLRAKSLLLTGYLEFLLTQKPARNFTIITPREPEQRGAQLSLRMHREGKAILKRLLALNVICDWREPDLIRVAPVPLYNSFEEAQRFAEVFLRLTL